MKRMICLFLISLIAVGAVAASGKSEKGSNAVVSQNMDEPGSFIKIPGGTFTIGPAEMYGAATEVQPEITISSFYMNSRPVTQKDYQKIMGSDPAHYKGDNLPVDQISWFDAVEYCNRLSQLEGLTPAYTINGTNVAWNRAANGYRLPTEAEWEYAARAGTNTPFNADGSHPWGLKDMPADIWEWCWDWYGSYQSGAFTDPTGAASGANRVLRAGNFGMCEPRGVIVRLRSHSLPSEKGMAIGFRVARP